MNGKKEDMQRAKLMKDINHYVDDDRTRVLNEKEKIHQLIVI